MNAVLVWNAVTRNADGSVVKGPVTYEVYAYGQERALVVGLTECVYRFYKLPPGTACWYVRAVVNGMASGISNVVCKEI